MLRTLCRAKIHRATVTEANLHYIGSITIDQELCDAAGILPYERVQVVNIHNGARFETYVMPGPPGSGQICVNGAAARLAAPGDLVIIIAYALFTEEEARGHVPVVVLVDERNRLVRVGRADALVAEPSQGEESGPPW